MEIRSPTILDEKITRFNQDLQFLVLSKKFKDYTTNPAGIPQTCWEEHALPTRSILWVFSLCTIASPRYLLNLNDTIMQSVPFLLANQYDGLHGKYEGY